MYFFVDCETGGVDASLNPILSVGGIVTDANLSVIDEFEIMIQPNESLTVTEQALAINQLDLDVLRRDGLTIEAAYQFISERTMVYPRLILTGWNVQFDLSFLKQLGTFYNFSRRLLDIQSVFQFMYLHEKHTSLDVACACAGVHREFHAALNDARATLEVSRFLRGKLKK